MVLTENSESDNNLILHGIKLAGAFKKELCFLHLPAILNTSKPEQIPAVLEGYRKIVKKEVPALRVSTLILSGKPENLMEILTDKYEIILIITRAVQYKKLSAAIKISPVPFLFINAKQTSVPDYKKIILPVDLRKEAKDAILWASYFARFNRSGINVLAANDKDKENIRNVMKNVVQIKKLFTKFNIGFRVFKGTVNSLKIQFEALEKAKALKADMIIILASSYVSFLDLLIGLPEKKILKNAGDVPVLIINPRKDMYIMCD